MRNTEGVLKNAAEGSPGGFGYVQKNNHSITQGLGMELTETRFCEWS
ncbi:MAG: hypothetical protein ABSC38_03820 [Verrucomicrobiia bacterium]